MTLAAVTDVVAGLALLAAGVAAWALARDSRTGPLLVLAGTTWLAGDFSEALVHASRGPLVHVVLTFPTGRTRSKATIGVIVAAYVDGLFPAAASVPVVTIALGAAVLVLAVRRATTAQALDRRASLVAFVCAALLMGPLLLAAAGRVTGAATYTLATWTYDAAIVVTAVLLCVELLAGQPVRAAATELVVDLADRHEPRALRDVLSKTVGDPTFEIAYAVDDTWVDEAGNPLRLPAPGDAGPRAVTFVEDDGSRIAALVHDPAALRDPVLAQSVGAAVRLVLANVRLRAEDAARLRDVFASRRRLVEAGDEQRSRLREQLRGGAEQTLTRVSRDLAAIADARDDGSVTTLRALIGELDDARADLDRFAQGIHPRSLAESGLTAALRELADQAAVPVVLTSTTERPPAPVEAAVFFVCSEALTNVAKYAKASSVAIDVAEAGPTLTVRIVDDGCGGADPSRGSGLRGLEDRVEALGGRISIQSPVGIGTRLEVELPLGVNRL